MPALLRRIVPALCLLLASAASTALAAGGAAPVHRRDFSVVSADGLRIHVREVATGAARGAPLILLHGARAPGVASFDLPVPGGSLAEDLARRTGRAVYVMDARGYGGSDRPAAMRQPPSASTPLSRGYEVVRDVDAVVAEASRRHHGAPVALLGWATGGMWAAYYASLHPERVSHLVMLNALYGHTSVPAPHPVLGPGSGTSDPAHPDRLHPEIGGYAYYTKDSLYGAWDRTIPVADKAAWRDPAVAEAYGEATLGSDPLARQQTPARLRAPLGAIEDSFYQAAGHQLFDASSISGRVLIVHGSLDDFWSRPQDGEAFKRDAVHARSVRLLEIPQATHFMHLDRPQHGRDRLIEAVAGFLDQR